MFEYIESIKNDFNIATQGFGDTNLEDVFLAVSKLNKHHNENNAIEFQIEGSKVSYFISWFQHFIALIIKRFRYYTRDTFGIACEILLPLVCICIGLVMTDIGATWSADQRPIHFNPKLLFNQNVNDLPTYMASNTSF